MPKGYKFCLLKNEFGDVKVDSQIAKLKNIDVQEMTNGCLCCVLVGQMKEGLLELKEKYNPDRIIIETSGSAFPGPIAWQVRELADDGFVLDSILNVVDCKNFDGYADNSYTAQLQAKYTDLVLLTKHEGVSERDLDRVIDRVNDLNTDAPKVYVHVDKPVSPELIFGLDTKLFELQGAMAPNNQTFQEELDRHGKKSHHKNELDTMEVKCFSDRNNTLTGQLTLEKFETFLATLDKDEVYRLKGFVRLSGIAQEGSDQTTSSICVINHAFGKWTITPVPEKLNVAHEDEEKRTQCHDEHCHDEHHHHHASSQKNEDHELQMHLIIMGDLWAYKYKLIYGCGAEYPIGRVLCEYKASSDVITWDKMHPGTYNEFVAEQMAAKQ
ncbi:hypothetical protein BGZ99_010074 [Dissophora globulifera]|uniref:CobW/HypB/UreG nucleotide-binding domain-containing protein n=1 Tax=Dissophora globulifera TaxID=979702 RepID=A0A9P6R703_9FUNG|nr:hypothetical protein BGZ99_010074 [Dissophora globulifera]